MNDSIETSLTLKIFKNKKEAILAHNIAKCKKFSTRWSTSNSRTLFGTQKINNGEFDS